MNRRRLLAASMALLGLGLGLESAIGAEPYPNRPIHYVVPFPPGGAVDTVARLIADKLSSRLGQPVLVENRPGGGGLAGSRAVAKAAPDGYTLLAVSFNYLTFPSFFRDPGLDIVKDLRPVILVSTYPTILVSAMNVPATNAKELVALAKRQPGALTFGSSSFGGGGHISGELFRQSAKVDVRHVPYKGAAPMTVDLLGNRISIAFAHITSIIEHIRAKRVRALAITSAVRSPLLPEVPTMIEEGFAGFETGELNGVVAPVDTPQDIVDRLNREISAIVTSEDGRRILESEGAQIVASTPAAFGEFINAQAVKWARLAKEAGIEPQ